MNIMYINRKNLINNLTTIKTLSNKKICAVVKANAYGHGLSIITKLLSGKVDFFAVANLQEALKIRQIDKTTPIIILFKCDNYILASKNNISVSVYSIKQAIEISKIKFKTPLKIHFKVNVGMNRLGFFNFNQIKKSQKILNNCFVEGLYTHYSTIKSYPQTYKKQIQKFNKFIKYFKRKYPNILIHTGGSLDFINKNSQMIRTGLYLYGYGHKDLKPVMSICAPIIQINKLKNYDYCGYDKEWKSLKNQYIATIPIGYQDGIRKFFVGSYVKLGCFKYRILAVCMDCIMIEIPCFNIENKLVKVFYNADIYKNKSLQYETLINFNGFRGKRKIIY